MKVLPKYEGIEIVQRTYKAGAIEYHRYEVPGYDCGGHCADCRATKKRPCKGLPSVTSFTGAYGGIGGAYIGGMNHILNSVFGEYTSKTKDSVKDGGWMSDFLRSPDADTDLLRCRQEVEEMPTPGDISRDYGTGVHAALESVLVGDGEVPSQYAGSVADIMAWLNRGGKDGPYIAKIRWSDRLRGPVWRSRDYHRLEIRQGNLPQPRHASGCLCDGLFRDDGVGSQ